MQLKQIAHVFPNQLSNWPVLHPSKALSFHIKSFIRNSWGQYFFANDLNKKTLPNRLGVLTRNFQHGDPLKTLSRPHILRLNLFVTKLDVSLGRKNALILFHRYPNMTYCSQFSQVNKGQVANAICALLEEIHKTLGQSVAIHSLEGAHFFEACQQYHQTLKSYEVVYFISDFLFNPSTLNSSEEEVIKTIQYFNLQKCVFFIVRDSLEFPEKKGQENVELLPWSQTKLNTEIRLSDGNYNQNLEKQLSDFKNSIQLTQNKSMVILPTQTISNFFHFMKREEIL